MGDFDLVMNEMGVDESDCEAIGCKLDGERNGGDYMALERIGK